MKLINTIRLPKNQETRASLIEMLNECKESVCFLDVLEQSDQNIIYDLDTSLPILGLMPQFREGVLAAEKDPDRLEDYMLGIDSLYRSMLLDTLFRDGLVNTRKLQNGIYKKYGFVNGEIFNKAAFEIYEICKNGGKITDQNMNI